MVRPLAVGAARFMKKRRKWLIFVSLAALIQGVYFVKSHTASNTTNTSTAKISTADISTMDISTTSQLSTTPNGSTPVYLVYRSKFFRKSIIPKQRRVCGDCVADWSSAPLDEHLADVRVYHWCKGRRVRNSGKNKAFHSPSIATMLESELNYHLIANFTRAGFDYSASLDPRSDFVRTAVDYRKMYAKAAKNSRNSTPLAQIRGASFVAKNCNPARAAWVSKVSQFFPVYSLGLCRPANTITRNTARSEGKVNLLREYTHHLAFENSVTDGYVTEKLFDALIAHTIPIYYGAKDVKRIVGFQPVTVEEVVTRQEMPTSFPYLNPKWLPPQDDLQCGACHLARESRGILKHSKIDEILQRADSTATADHKPRTRKVTRGEHVVVHGGVKEEYMNQGAIPIGPSSNPGRVTVKTDTGKTLTVSPRDLAVASM